MKLSTKLDLSNYGSSFAWAAGLQVLVILVTSANLDGGASLITASCAAVAFWATVFLLIRRHKENPPEGVLMFIRSGYLLMLLLAGLAHEMAWRVAH